MTTLKKFLDTQIGEHGRVEILRSSGTFLCEGIVKDLRQSPLWRLMDEENAKCKQAMHIEKADGKYVQIMIA
ncbi:MAG: hypothetical protein FWB80_04485 [Defluviitaleaceae bacterium]|nr:hypothetical protein [Defluviitaleaceae bacterium]